ncbi:MAG: hypothetical protein IKJ06_01345, partial [Clostridia bacterium]|nr:hypothetical protein [Clostridia bacterium]
MKGKKSGGRRVYEAKCRAHDEAQEHRRRAQMATRKYSLKIEYISGYIVCKEYSLFKNSRSFK